ncbi:serine/threonine-protein phosphatase 6 regulatory ankyrin repeat subunit B-like [Takifugu flavidus]|uniref:serine/threonine-protein phosphatase 6 regulatory ankyrin repeat subunit B-like n=1 Tax=Takifugu flavidus TaxID=433684 RepID=UPI0025441A1C|nr:serine/threonine-protein phosphatase 6 regulatory ankyrin repeat subunit B-like [Takifugu flavidus]
MAVLKLAEQPPLIQAIFSGDPEEIRMLIYKSEDINALDPEKRTPLHAAAFLGDAEITGLLILSGARVNAKDNMWLTPLHRAVASRSEVNTHTHTHRYSGEELKLVTLTPPWLFLFQSSLSLVQLNQPSCIAFMFSK